MHSVLQPDLCMGDMISIFSGLYRHPNADADSLLELRSNLDKSDESCRLIIMGDFNLPHIDWSREYPTLKVNKT